MSILKKLGLKDVLNKDRNANLITWLVVLFLVVFTLMILPSLPDEIPTHFNLSGEADGYSGKNSLIGLVALTIGMAVLLHVLTFYPSLYNTTVKITDENRAIQQELAVSMLRQLNTFITVCMSYIVICISMIAKGMITSKSLGIYFMIVLMGGLAWIIGNYMLKARANK